MARAESTRSSAGNGPPGIDPWEARAVPLALLLLAVLLVQGLIFIGEASQTSDEAAHLAAGYSYLTKGDFRLNPEHPPLIKEWAALPLLPLDLVFPSGSLWEQAEEWNIGRLFVHENRLPNDTLLLLGRLPVLLLSLLLGWFLFRWGRTLFGARGALLGLALYVLDPNVVAHSSLVTTDLGETLFIYLAVYALWTWTERPSPAGLAVCGAMVGGAFAAKFTSIWLVPIFGALLSGLLLLRSPVPGIPWRKGPGDPRATLSRRLAGLGLAALCLTAVSFVVLAASYGFKGLPAYVVGLQRGLWHSGIGHMAYLNGAYSDDGWWYYFLYAYLVKTPIGTLLLVAWTLAALLRGSRLRMKEEMFLWIPIAGVVAITSLWKVNIGLRHILPVYPFLYIAAGRILMPRGGADPGRAGRPAAVLVAACLAWNVVAAAGIAPHHLAYFNEIAGGPRNGHLHLLDSNLDWGQSAKALRRYAEQENLPVIYCAFSGNSDPWYYGLRYQYTPGSGNLDNAKTRPVRVPANAPREVLAISAMVLHSVHFLDETDKGSVASHDLYEPFRSQTPVAMPGYSFLVYDITRSAGAHSYLAALHLSFRQLELAGYEAGKALAIDPRNAIALAVLEKLRESDSPSTNGGAPPKAPAPSRP
jgi:4-amino-4-deoxy-L-arabinose transferase-like glycosyltransferase